MTIFSKYECPAEPRVVIRLRAVAASAGAWRRKAPYYFELKTQVSRMQLVVQTPSRDRLAYATIAGSELRMWGSPSCRRS